jgi:hypothetical protein
MIGRRPPWLGLRFAQNAWRNTRIHLTDVFTLNLSLARSAVRKSGWKQAMCGSAKAKLAFKQPEIC